MKKMTSFKGLVVGMVFLTGVGIGSASAQTVRQSDSVKPAVSTSSAPSAAARTQAHRDEQSGVFFVAGTTSVALQLKPYRDAKGPPVSRNFSISTIKKLCLSRLD